MLLKNITQLIFNFSTQIDNGALLFSRLGNKITFNKVKLLGVDC